MRMWLIKVGEPLPCDRERPRRLRTGTIAEMLVERGHTVVWWSSTFNQITRTQRFPRDTLLELSDRYRLWLLHSPGYKKNVSVARILYHRRTARAFQRLAIGEPKPDVILCSMPTIENSLAATEYGRRHGVPVVLDCRDMWPDIIMDRFPKFAQPFARILLQPMYRGLRIAARRAEAVTGITDDFVDWALGYANRMRCQADQAFPLAYSASAPSQEAQRDAYRYWSDMGIGREAKEFVVCFFGNISPRYELEDVIHAARLLTNEEPRCRFVICGDGEALRKLRREASGLTNVVFPGWLGAAQIWTLMRLSRAGIVPYPSTRDYLISVPNKAIEYLSAGLPVVTSLTGTLQRLLEVNECGVRYVNGDVRQLARLVSELACAPARHARMSLNAKRVFNERFVAETVYGRMCDHLEQLGKKGGVARRSRIAA